jgi:hypothetical protein
MERPKDSIAEQAVCAAAAAEMPKLADGSINLQELFCQLAEIVVNAVMDAGDEGDMLGPWQQ